MEVIVHITLFGLTKVLYLVTRYNNFVDEKEQKIKRCIIQLSVQLWNHSSLTVKKFWSVNVKEKSSSSQKIFTRQLVLKKNDKKKNIQSLVLEKYKLPFGDIKPSLEKREEIFRLYPDTVLLKEPGLYCFFWRCKKNEVEPFMEWSVKTVLQREVLKLASATEDMSKQMHCSMIIYMNKTTGPRLFIMSMWNCRSNEIFLRPSCKDVKIRSYDLIINCSIPRANDPGKDNIAIIIVRKHHP